MRQAISFFYLLAISIGGASFECLNSSYQTFVRMSNSGFHELMLVCSFQGCSVFVFPFWNFSVQCQNKLWQCLESQISGHGKTLHSLFDFVIYKRAQSFLLQSCYLGKTFHLLQNRKACILVKVKYMSLKNKSICFSSKCLQKYSWRRMLCRCNEPQLSTLHPQKLFLWNVQHMLFFVELTSI